MALLLQNKVRFPDPSAAYDRGNEAEFRRLLEITINALSGIDVTTAGDGSGSGTQHRIPKWATTSSLGDSNMRDGNTAGLLEIGLSAARMLVQGVHTPGLNTDGHGLDIEATLNRHSTGSHPVMAGTRMRQPVIGAGAAGITNAATLRIDDAPSVGSNRYSLMINAGVAYFGGGATFPVGATVSFLQNPGFTCNPGAGAAAFNIASGVLSLTSFSAAPAISNAGALVQINGTIAEASSGTHSFLAGMWLAAPTITNGSATTSTAATLYVAGAPTGITPTNPVRSVWVGAGLSFFEGPVRAQIFRAQKQAFTNGASISPAITSGSYIAWELNSGASDNPVTFNAPSGGTDGDICEVSIYNARVAANTVNFASGFTMTAAAESISIGVNERFSIRFIYNGSYSTWQQIGAHATAMAAST